MKKLMFALAVATAGVAMAAVDGSVYNLTFTDKSMGEDGKVVTTKLNGLLIRRGAVDTVYSWDKSDKDVYTNRFAKAPTLNRDGSIKKDNPVKLANGYVEPDFKLADGQLVLTKGKGDAGFTNGAQTGWGSGTIDKSTGLYKSIAGNTVDMGDVKAYGTWKLSFDKKSTTMLATADDVEILAKKGVELVK